MTAQTRGAIGARFFVPAEVRERRLSDNFRLPIKSPRPHFRTGKTMQNWLRERDFRLKI
jgi:hypothetical protein